MSLTCGFFNSNNHDRLYNATHFNKMFDGIINDGIFNNVGNCFGVTAGNGMEVLVGTGRAWLEDTWTLIEDEPYPLSIDIAPALSTNTRIDAVVITVDSSDNVRDNSVEIVKGAEFTTGTSDKLPILASNQHPIAYIRVKSGTTVMTDNLITNVVGGSATDAKPGTPWVTSPLVSGGGGSTITTSYGKTLPSKGTEGQVFILLEE